jgi:hypothetical protein
MMKDGGKAVGCTPTECARMCKCVGDSPKTSPDQPLDFVTLFYPDDIFMKYS